MPWRSWFRPHNGLFDRQEYWQHAFEVIDEILAQLQPCTYFHIGMDEDHWRSYTQYVEAIKTLHAGLKERGLRTMIWNDSARGWPEAHIHLEKSVYAESRIPTEITQIVLDYAAAVDRTIFERVRDAGFSTWGAPGDTNIQTMKAVLSETRCQGLIMTRWIPCIEANREKLLARVRSI